jgi:regulation of enolase protein 1 (concanavalin A-like superfamily)
MAHNTETTIIHVHPVLSEWIPSSSQYADRQGFLSSLISSQVSEYSILMVLNYPQTCKFVQTRNTLFGRVHLSIRRTKYRLSRAHAKPCQEWVRGSGLTKADVSAYNSVHECINGGFTAESLGPVVTGSP